MLTHLFYTAFLSLIAFAAFSAHNYIASCIDVKVATDILIWYTSGSHTACHNSRIRNSSFPLFAYNLYIFKLFFTFNTFAQRLYLLLLCWRLLKYEWIKNFNYRLLLSTTLGYRAKMVMQKSRDFQNHSTKAYFFFLYWTHH